MKPLDTVSFQKNYIKANHKLGKAGGYRLTRPATNRHTIAAITSGLGEPHPIETTREPYVVVMLDSFITRNTRFGRVGSYVKPPEPDAPAATTLTLERQDAQILMVALAQAIADLDKEVGK